jgi:hypothetical protein
MAMGCVFAQADIGDDDQLGQGTLQLAHGALDNAVLRISPGGAGVLGIRNTEQENRRHTEIVGTDGFPDEFIGGELVNTGHGTNLAAHLFSSDGEERQDQLIDAQACFGEEPSQGGSLAQPARAVSRELSER